MQTTFSQFAPLRALRAARDLAANPDDLPKVFTIIESLQGKNLHRIQERMSKSEHGRRILAEKPDIVDVLSDREALRRLPEGTLGRAYLDFVESENISAEGIRAAAEQGSTDQPIPAPLDYVHARLRDTHDLWHAAIGYRGDVLGEAALLAFILAQTKSSAIGLVVAIAILKTLRAPEARKVILDGFRRGQKAAWLPDQEWESLLALPVEEVRRRLSLETPPVYTPVRSSDLRAQQAAA